MNNKSRRVTRRTARRSKSHPGLYKDKDDTAGVAILVSPSATGKGIHKRWKYSEPHLNIHQTIPTKQDSTAHALTRKRTFRVDGAFTDMFNRSPPSVVADPEADNHTSDSSTPPLENVLSVTSDEDIPKTPKQCSLVPRYTIVLPDEEAAMREMLKKEQQIEDTFRIQWEKMLKERKAAMRTIKSWVRKGRPRYDTSGTDDEDTKDEVEGPRTDTAMSTSKHGMNRMQNGESGKVELRRRPLGPCGTIIIEDPYKRGDRTSPPLVYPSEWVARRLAGRESTESI